MDNSLLQLFPVQARCFWEDTAVRQNEIREIRLRVNRPIVLYGKQGEYFLTEEGKPTGNIEEAYCITVKELNELLEHICGYSLYAYENELRQGFLTVCGGHRVGVAGQVVLEHFEEIKTIKNISFMNIRISHEIKGVGDKVIPYLYERGRLRNTLIISPPGCGKTTMLRDIIRQISNGNLYGQGKNVGVVDERSEIAGVFQGKPQNDLGERTDVLDGCPKYLGMMMLLRSMAPEVIAVDELGNEKDMHGLKCASACGCKLLATVHGENMEDVTRRFALGQEIWNYLFQTIVILGRKEDKFLVSDIKRFDGETERKTCGLLELS